MDHITNGRMAFNVITSARRSDFANYGYDGLPEHSERYERLEEFIDVCRALWKSVEPDAFLWDKASGRIADPAKVHPINHQGKFFKVKGPLSVVPSPQGSPVEALISDVPIEAVGVWLSHNTGYDMSQLPPRFSLAELQERIVAAQASPVGFVNLLAHKYGEHAEIDREEFFRHGLESATGYATALTGTAAQIADRFEEIFEATGSRGGFMVKQSQAGPREIMLNIVDHLVPELQKRGRYRNSYEGKTLRENLAV